MVEGKSKNGQPVREPIAGDYAQGERLLQARMEAARAQRVIEIVANVMVMTVREARPRRARDIGECQSPRGEYPANLLRKGVPGLGHAAGCARRVTNGAKRFISAGIQDKELVRDCGRSQLSQLSLCRMCYSDGVLKCVLLPSCYFTYTAMDAERFTRSSGAKLKQLRDRLGLTLREVEARSRKLAEEKKSQDYFVSRGWLNNVENSSLTPSIYKIYALGIIYQENWSNILSFFGLRVAEIGRDQALFGFPNTRLVTGSGEQEIPGNLIVPLRTREDLRLEKTNLLTRLREIWGEIPVPLLQHLDLRKFVYGYVGLQDFTMHPLVRPGSFVQIDESQRKIRPGTWQNEFERPIYFIELRGAYICSWCEIKEGHLLSIPYSTSPCAIRRYPYPKEAEVVGRVTGVAMRIAATIGGGKTRERPT